MDAIILELTAAAMAGLTAWLLKKGSEVRTLTDAGLVVFLFVMMASMFASSVVYLYSSTFVTLFELVALNMVSMSVGLIPVLMALFKGDRPLEETRRGNAISSRSLVIVAMVSLALLSEAFMGWTFALSSGVASTSQAPVSSLVESMSSYWFVFTMAGEMAATLYMVGSRFPKWIRRLVAVQVAVMVLSPTAVSSASWSTYSSVGSSVAMIAAIIVIMEYVFRKRTLAAGESAYLLRLMGAYTLMMGGLFLWLMDGDPLLFVLSIVGEMVAYFAIVLDEGSLVSQPLVSWQSRPLWTFGLLGGVFLAEFFMGGVLDVVADGTRYFTSLPFAAIGVPGLTAAGAVFYDFIVAVGSVTASFWFLAMMGVEMGALVVFKMRYARETETKLRLALMLAAYAIYALYLPTFAFPDSLPRVPFVGWSMGLGTAGAAAPDVIAVILATYLISGTLSFLFGSRNLCSVFCTAAVMYQGTTYDSMSSFNRTSKVGRHLLTSRITGAYKVVASLVWVSLLAGAALSYLNSEGVVRASFFGADISGFLYSFYFSFLWYLVWVMIPFLGTYACATTGVCGWGSFNHLVSRFGLFKLRVRSGDTCVSCKTKDCAKVCPVGLTDMPGAFIEKGEFKSFKCIGVGDCVSACPYNNVFFFDVRNWVRMKLNKPLPPLSRPVVAGSSEAPIDFTAAGKEP
ncbi:MAG: 4Fe-4S dicluster domain-containing protein [Nitrososphaerota archaeon]|nr:4Fe-4S dicluster domain-containing protein [Nitrososphaerota archaeon]MDG6978966.1 4Fe-4S dicluster domain-containing protein [Nitrososphaerota archaeon]MDG6981440.1 4Fe-4S dicluster domain-containing protein [Nitrososphaerota archaeon]MDG7020909.1 4Fe-4S dicluster domain-containing protein [Nitrososphaerota archaeon]